MDTARLRYLPKLIGSLLLVTVAGFSACTAEERNYGEGGGGSGSSSSSSGAPQQCSMASECGANDECQSFTCEGGLCKVNFTPMGTPVALQALGDCQSNVCDGNGYVITISDLADPVDDGNPCTLDACVGMMTQHGFLGAGTPCQGTYFCDGFGACVECLESAQCSSGVCASNVCAAPECTDNTLNGLETDVDCGGFQCPQCAPGAKCVGDPDCKSLVCKSGICAEPTCSDGVKNGAESDLDCGGPGCPPCAPNQQCNSGLDCSSLVCAGNVCQEPACDDQIQNGNETDVDCGGISCLKCANGRGCLIAKDCFSNNCCFPDPALPFGYCEKSGLACPLLARPEISQ